MDLKVVPNLDQIATDPAAARDLPADVRQTLTARAIGVLNALFAAGLADATGSNGLVPADVDRLLDVNMAAAKLGMKKATLYRRAKSDPAIRAMIVDTGVRRLLFSEQKIESFLRRRTGR